MVRDLTKRILLLESVLKELVEAKEMDDAARDLQKGYVVAYRRLRKAFERAEAVLKQAS